MGAMRQMSLFVVGAAFPNRDGSNRRFEIMLCTPGEPVTLRREPKNPADGNAVAVLSARGIQIGYLAAERAQWFAAKLDQGKPIRAIFQEQTTHGAAIRVDLDGDEPVLPPAKADNDPARPARQKAAGDDGFWPDEVWDD